MYRIVALGESLIDFTPAGKNERGLPLFCQNPGGAPANVLAMAAKLGASTAMIGKVGNDGFGRFLIENMRAAGVDTRGVLFDETVPTTLAFVHLSPDGDRSFSFYRKPGADVMLKSEELPADILQNCRIFQFGGVSLTDEPCRTATLTAAKTAKAAGALVSFDPNYRPLLWKNEKAAAEELKAAAALADIMKVSEEELVLLTGTDDVAAGSDRLRALGPQVVIVTLGPGGAYVNTGAVRLHSAAYDVQVADTTGSGDAFLGSLLWQVAESETFCGAWDESEGAWALDLSNAAGSLTATAGGAIPAMPDKAAIADCMARLPRVNG